MSKNLIPTKRISESDLFDYIVELVGKHAETLDQKDGFLDAFEQSIAHIKCELDQVGSRECDLYIKGRKEKHLRNEQQTKTHMSKKPPLRAVLKKDILIPAGTVFEEAPMQSSYSGDWVEHVVGLTKDTCGHFRYPLYLPRDGEFKDLQEWFEIVEAEHP